MIFRSIRWTLLFWYAVILVGALAALGWTLLDQQRKSLYRDADALLATWIATARHAANEYPADGLSREIASALPPEAEFAVWDGQARRVAASGAAMVSDPPARVGVETRGKLRVLSESLEGGGHLTVGMNVEAAHHRIRDFLVALLSASAAIIGVALVGGWLLVGRALAPVRRMSETARHITAENLGERIDEARIHAELGGLARSLNDCFDRLEAAIARQARFTADASHELRTPLAIASAHLDLARTREHSERRLDERLDIVKDALRRIQTVVEGLLTLARAESDALPIAKSPVALVPLLEEVRDTFEPLAAAKEVTIEHHLEAVSVTGEADQLREIATNLYSNAVAYDREGGTITVTLARQGDDAVLTVADTGIGIEEADRSRVFERFFRADTARSRSRGGTGLGLAITRHLVRLHEGTISVESQPGQGTTFTVRLPATD